MCIRSKISEYHLDLWTWLNLVCVRPQEAGGRETSISPSATDALGLAVRVAVPAREKMPEWEPTADRGLWALSDPRLSSPARMRKKCCYGKKNFGSICNSLSPSPTHLSHTRNINAFGNKVWEVYFLQRSVFIRSLKFVIIVDYVSAYSCIMSIQHNAKFWFNCYYMIVIIKIFSIIHFIFHHIFFICRWSFFLTQLYIKYSTQLTKAWAAIDSGDWGWRQLHWIDVSSTT